MENGSKAKVSEPPFLEGFCILLTSAVVTLAWAASLDGLSLGWDTLNHHFYLGWMAIDGSRLQQDAFAAGSMSCQYSFTYGPLYWLQINGASGRDAAMILALPAIGAAPAIWLITWSLLPQRTTHACIGACYLHVQWPFLSPLWWSLVDSTSNDISSSLPMLWAFSLMIWRSACDLDSNSPKGNRLSTAAWMGLVGVLSAVALVLKISHVFAMLGLLVLTIASSSGIRSAFFRLAALSSRWGVGWLFLYRWPWARQIWKYCGSPFYPMLTESLRPFSAYLTMSRFRPDGLSELLTKTFEIADFRAGVYVEIIAADLMPAGLVIAILLTLIQLARSRLQAAPPLTQINTPATNPRLIFSILLGWTVSWSSWLFISGNGRYILPILITTGPLLGILLLNILKRKDW